MPERRPLAFESLDQIKADLDQHTTAPTMVGRWTFGEVCDHLARAFNRTNNAPLPDPSVAPTPEQLANREAFFRDRAIPEGNPLPVPDLEPTPGVDPDHAAQSLRDAIDRLGSREGRGPVHPRLGPMTFQEWARFHQIHSAHHLSFALPA